MLTWLMDYGVPPSCPRERVERGADGAQSHKYRSRSISCDMWSQSRNAALIMVVCDPACFRESILNCAVDAQNGDLQSIRDQPLFLKELCRDSAWSIRLDASSTCSQIPLGEP